MTRYDWKKVGENIDNLPDGLAVAAAFVLVALIAVAIMLAVVGCVATIKWNPLAGGLLAAAIVLGGPINLLLVVWHRVSRGTERLTPEQEEWARLHFQALNELDKEDDS